MQTENDWKLKKEKNCWKILKEKKFEIQEEMLEKSKWSCRKERKTCWENYKKVEGKLKKNMRKENGRKWNSRKSLKIFYKKMLGK